MRLLPLPGVFQPPSDSWMLVECLRRERLVAQSHGDLVARSGGGLVARPVGLDLCTGSGVLAIAAALHCGARMTAVDVSRRAVGAAWLNARLNGADVHPVRGNLYSPVQAQRFDMIVSNPPYLPTPDGSIPQRGLARAWEGGHDGRTFVDRICDGAAEHLHPGGVILLVHSSVCGEADTLARLRGQGLEAEVVFRHRGELGPLLRSRQQWLRERGLLLEDGREEMLVIRGQLPVKPGRRAATSPPAPRAALA